MAKILDLGPAVINCATATTVEDKPKTDKAQNKEEPNHE